MKRNKEFEDWCLSATASMPNGALSIQTFLNKMEVNKKDLNIALEQLIRAATDANQPINLEISRDFNRSIVFAFNHQLPKIVDGKSQSPIEHMAIRSGDDLALKNAIIKNMTVSMRGKGKAFLENCYVAELEVRNSDGPQSLVIERGRVGTLRLNSRSLKFLQIMNSEIHCVDCSVPEGDNPFQGSVSFDAVKFPTSEKESALFPGKQQFHNLRHHLEKLENTFEAQKMRALELRAERPLETSRLNKLINWYQDFSSEYGLKAGRPLLVALALYSSMVFLSFISGWAVLDTRAPADFYGIGWRTVLKDDFASCLWLLGSTPSCGNWSRALLLPGQYILNPFGIFGAQSLLVAVNGLVNVGLTLAGLFCDLLIATSFLAIRKRFKLH